MVGPGGSQRSLVAVGETPLSEWLLQARRGLSPLVTEAHLLHLGREALLARLACLSAGPNTPKPSAAPLPALQSLHISHTDFTSLHSVTTHTATHLFA